MSDGKPWMDLSEYKKKEAHMGFLYVRGGGIQIRIQARVFHTPVIRKEEMHHGSKTKCA